MELKHNHVKNLRAPRHEKAVETAFRGNTRGTLDILCRVNTGCGVLCPALEVMICIRSNITVVKDAGMVQQILVPALSPVYRVLSDAW
jgi:hypothetical protein